MSCSDIFLGVIAILFPPIAVWIKTGLCSCDSVINILLCMLGYIPGLLHAWYIIAKHPEHDYDRLDDPERQGRVTYYYVSHEPSGRRTRRQQQRADNYGTIPAAPGNKPTPQQPHYQPPQQPRYQPSSSQSAQQSGVVRTENTSNGSLPGSLSTGAGPSRPSGSSDPSSSDAPPPSYSEVIRGDHKIQN